MMERLRNHPPADAVIFVLAPDGRILSQQALDTAARRRQPATTTVSSWIEAGSIASVEVLKGGALPKLSHIGGAIVITLKPEGVERYLKLRESR
jgi:hypothetical protein